tara:strand:- start:267 stop:407 length:141 start_codon:yes stop_codon:yes gene_type:complete
MTLNEKIAHAKRRIDELERLINYWAKSDDKNSKVANFQLEVDKKVA